MDPLSDDENEDLSCAIELSLLDATRNETDARAEEFPCIDEDEQLVKALEESFRYSRKSRNLNIWKRNKDYPSTTVCDVCEERVSSAWSRCPYWGQTFCLKHRADGTPRCYGCHRFKVTRSFQKGENVEVWKEVQYLYPRHEVTSVLVLYGLPKLLAGSTLAHEMMHAWMQLRGYRGLEPKVAEGICEVMAHKWLDWHAFIGDDFLSGTTEQAQFLRNLKEELKERIERNYSETYGGGFREAKWAVERYGLKYTMKHIAETGKFPE